MPTTQTREKRTQKNEWEICIDAVTEMEPILDELEDYCDADREAAALRKQLTRIKKVCERSNAKAKSLQGNDPQTAARNFVAQLPLREIFQDKALADAFLSELLLAVARESSHENRRELQRKGIEEAKAQGVRFGAPTRPLPDNFEEARQAWRNGQLSMNEAAELCGMPKSTFYNAAQRAERNARENEERAYM